MSYWVFLILPFLIFSNPIFAQNHDPDDYSDTEYKLNIDQHTYAISYVVKADIIAMNIDPESKSLLIGVKNTHDTQFTIDLEHELISAPNNQYVILVDGQEAYYDIISDDESSTIDFFVPEGSEEIEIIGTHVIPEFPIGAVFGLIVMISSIIIFAKIKSPFFKL